MPDRAVRWGRAALGFLVVAGAVLAGTSPRRAAADPVELVPDGGFEAPGTDPATPAGWYPVVWGDIAASLSVPTGGAHSGDHSARVDVVRRASGAAGFSFTPQPVTANATYRYRTWYRSDAATELLAVFVAGDGSLSYRWLAAPGPAATWTPASALVTVPAGTVALSVRHSLPAVGQLDTDDVSLAPYVAPPPPTRAGIVVNGDLESADPLAPDHPIGWHSARWGTNTATFTYPAGGAHGGSGSVRLDVSAYTDGGATWAFDDQPVDAGTVYRLTSWYRSDRPTEMLVAYRTAAGSQGYQWLADVPASPGGWTQFRKAFAAPAGATQLTVFQSLAGVGFVETDDVEVLAVAQSPPANLGLVPNGELEQASLLDPAVPTAWQHVDWGTNQAVFTYPVGDAHSGTGAARLDVTSYTDGGASWSFTPQPVNALEEYELVTWYRSSQPVEELAVITMADGSVRYRWLANAPASPAWSRVAGRFTTPAGAVAVTVLQSLTAVGFVEVDDVDVHAYTESAFARPLVSVSFDDGYASHATVALPELQVLGMKGTFYITTGDIGADGVPSEMTADQVRGLAAAGMEIGSHSVTHPDLTTLDDTALNAELADSQRALRELTGQSVNTFAAPFGTYDDRVRERIATLYTSHRSVDDGINERHTLDLTRIQTKLVLSTTTDAEVQDWLDQAKASRLWLVLVFHDLVDPPGDIYDTTPERFRAVMGLVADSGILVRTVGDAAEEVRPQVGTV